MTRRSQAGTRIPAVSEIAKIAAILAIGRDIAKPQNLTMLVNSAFALWEQCKRIRETEIDRQISYENLVAVAAESQFAFRMPKKYPVTYDDFLRLLISGNKARREKIYLNYVSEMIAAGHLRDLIHPRNPAEAVSEEQALKLVKPASQPEIDAWISSDKQTLIHSQDRYEMRASAFWRWYVEYRKESRQNRARKAAAAKWKKPKQENG